MPDYLGSAPSYEGITSALKSKLEEDELARQRQIQQSIGVRGIRTSGIGMVPTQEAARIRGSQEAGIYSELGGRRLQNIFQEQESERDRALQVQLQEMRGAQERDMARKQRRQAMMSALWSIPMNVATGGIGTMLQNAYPQTMNLNYGKYSPEEDNSYENLQTLGPRPGYWPLLRRR